MAIIMNSDWSRSRQLRIVEAPYVESQVRVAVWSMRPGAI
jgi:hypothetical protein